MLYCLPMARARLPTKKHSFLRHKRLATLTMLQENWALMVLEGGWVRKASRANIEHFCRASLLNSRKASRRLHQQRQSQHTTLASPAQLSAVLPCKESGGNSRGARKVFLLCCYMTRVFASQPPCSLSLSDISPAHSLAPSLSLSLSLSLYLSRVSLCLSHCLCFWLSSWPGWPGAPQKLCAVRDSLATGCRRFRRLSAL